MKSLRIVVIVSALIMLVCLIQPARAAEAPIVIKFSHQNPVSSHLHRGVEYFAQQMAEKTKGRVKTDIYPASMLYTDTQVIPAIRDGAIQMAFVTANQMESYVPIAEVMSLPFMIDKHEEARKIKQGPPAQLMIEGENKIGIKHIFFLDYAFVDIFTNKPAKKLDDLKGMKIRVVGGKTASDSIAALGASPVFISASELYMALSKGAADGFITGMDSVLSRKFYETTKYAMKIGLFFTTHPVVANLKWWNSLPEDIKTIMQQVAKDAESKVEQFCDESAQNNVVDLQKQGMSIYSLTREEKEPFIKATRPVWDDFAKRHGKEGEQLVQWIRANR